MQLVDVALDLGQSPGKEFQSEDRRDLLGGIVVLRHEGVAIEGSNKALYSRYTGKPVKTRSVRLTFIPYYAWANREASTMQVWTPLFRA